MRKKIGICLVCMMLVTSILVVFPIENVKAAGKTYYVSTTGSNSNSGTFYSPWKTIEYAMTKTSPGDTVYIMAGIYYDTTITTWSAASGTPGNFITYIAYGNGEVILDATGSASTWSGAIWIDSLKYIRISGLTIRDSSSFGILVECSSTCHNITIDNCKIYNCSSSGICFTGGTGSKIIKDLLVENNIIYDCQNNWYGTTTQEVVTFSQCSRFVFRNNYVYNGRTILVDIKNSCTSGYIYNNQIDTSKLNGGGTYGFYIDAGATYCKNLLFYNNVAWGCGTGYVLASEAGGNLVDISFYNNIYKGTQNAFKIDRYTGAGTHDKINLKFINNVIASCSTAFRFLEDDADVINLIVRNNIVKGTGGFDVPYIKLQNHNVDHNLYNVQSSNYYGTNSIYGSPCFVDPTNGDFHLMSNSPCINAGSSTFAPQTDYDGNSRVGAVDIGAFEYGSVNTALNRPPYPPDTPKPGNHTTGVTINADLSWWGGDPNGDTVTYDVYFGTTTTPSKVSSKQSATTYNLGTLSYNTKYHWKIIVWDEHGIITTGPLWDFTTVSSSYNPPNTPNIPTGPTTLLVGQSGTYSTYAVDPDGDQVQYGFDWNAGGSHEYSGWTPLVPSGQTAGFSHLWSNPGTYLVRVQARDEHGSVSGWSTGLTVTITGETIILGQQSTKYDTFNTVYSNRWSSQSFKSSLGVLTKVQLFIAKTGSPTNNLVVSIRSSPTGTDLTSVVKSPTSINSYLSWVEFDFPDISVTTGNTYYIVVRTSGGTSSQNYLWGYGYNNPYTRGSFWMSTNSGISWTQYTTYDLCYRTFGLTG